MIDRVGLTKIIDMVQRGEQLLPGEIMKLRDAVALLDDLANAMKIITGEESDLREYDLETTAQLKIIACDDHGGNRP